MPNPLAGVVQKVIDVADVDGVVRQIDVNAVVQRIEWNDVVQRIDWNELLSTIEWNGLLERVDFDTILQRVDTKAIVARSSRGIFDTFLDNLRTQVVMIDLYLIILTRCRFWHRQHSRRCVLPPKPGGRQRNDRQAYPKGRTNKAVAVQGRYCGFVSKAIAIFLDNLCVTVLFALAFRLMKWCLVLFLGDSQDVAASKTKGFQEDKAQLTLFLYYLYWSCYYFLTVGLAGQTMGMMLVGLRVCNCNRSNPYASVSMGQAFIRTCFLPLTAILCPPLAAIGLIRRDGRMLHDLIAGTGIIYLWDAEQAKDRRRSMMLERLDSAAFNEVDEEVLDELDEMMGDETEDPEEGWESLLSAQRNPAGPGRQQSNVDTSSYYSTFT